MTSDSHDNSSRTSIFIGVGLLLLTVAAFFRPPLLPEIGRELDISPLGLGLLGSIFAFGRTAADFPAGRLSDRISVGKMMFLGATAIAFGSVMLALAPSDLVAYGSMLLLGVGSTFALTTAMAHFARAPKARRGTALSAFAAWLLAGQSLGPTFGGLLATGGGWRLAMWVAAGLAGVMGIAFLWLRTPPPEPGEAGHHGDTPPLNVSRGLLGLIYLLPAVQFAIGGALLQTLVPIVADGELGIGPATVGIALGVGGGIRFVSALASGRISDRVSRRWALVPSQVVQALGVVVFMVWATPSTWFASIVLLTLGSTGVSIGATVLGDLSEGQAMGGRLGAFRFTGDAAFMVAPLLCGWLYEISGRVAATAPMAAFAVIVTIGIALFVPETGRRARPAAS